LVTFAGINSSATSQEAGNNYHLNSFEVTFPKKKQTEESEKDSAEAKIKFTTRASLFKAKKEGKARPYQRLLRLSPVTSREAPSRRICVAATGDAAKNEIVMFDATTAVPSESSVFARLSPPDGVEAVDLDLTEENDLGCFALAYCTDHEIYVCRLRYDFDSRKTVPSKPETTSVYTASASPGGKTGTSRPKIRCLRWLSPQHLLVLQKSGSSSAELVILNLSSSTGKINLRRALPKSLEVAAHLDICALDADPGSGERQFLVAVAGANRSRDSVIHVYTLDHRPSDPDPARPIWQLNKFSVLNSVHPSNIMRITFANFFPPKQNPNSTMSVATPSQYISLASVAWGGTVVIDTFTLTSTPTKPHDTGAARTSTTNPQGTPSIRWVLTTNSMTERLTSRAGIILIAMSVLVAAILLQSYITLTKGDAAAASPFRTAKSVIKKLQPPGARTMPAVLRRDGAVISSAVVSAASAASSVAAEFNPIPGVEHRFRDLLDWTQKSGKEVATAPQHHIHVRAPAPDESAAQGKAPQGLTASLLPVNRREELERLQKQGAKKWEELSVAEKEKWTRRMRDSGDYVEAVPESIFKAVLFSEWAAIVGGGLRDAVLN